MLARKVPQLRPDRPSENADIAILGLSHASLITGMMVVADGGKFQFWLSATKGSINDRTLRRYEERPIKPDFEYCAAAVPCIDAVPSVRTSGIWQNKPLFGRSITVVRPQQLSTLMAKLACARQPDTGPQSCDSAETPIRDRPKEVPQTWPRDRCKMGVTGE